MTNTTDLDPVTLMAQRGRMEWDERIGSAVSAAKNWRLACFMAMGITAIAVIGVIYIGAQSKIEPYVLDVSGERAAMMPPLSTLKAGALSHLYKKDLTDFVESVRTVYMDVSAQKKLIRDAYSYLMPGTPAYTQLTLMYKNKSPFVRAETELVKTEVTSVLPLSDNTYQVEWQETSSNRTGDVLSVKHFKATLNTVVIPPTSREAAAVNPLGFFIKTFNDVELR